MIDQQRHLITALDGAGWEVVQRERDGLDWWVDVVWILESRWSPYGRRVYLTFLNFPADEPPRVLAVAASVQRPGDWVEAERGPFLRLRGWRKDPDAFLQGLAELRQHITPA